MLEAAAAAASNPSTTLRSLLCPRKKSVQGLCVSSLQGALRCQTWLTEDKQDMALYQHHQACFLSLSTLQMVRILTPPSVL